MRCKSIIRAGYKTKVRTQLDVTFSTFKHFWALYMLSRRKNSSATEKIKIGLVVFLISYETPAGIKSRLKFSAAGSFWAL